MDLKDRYTSDFISQVLLGLYVGQLICTTENKELVSPIERLDGIYLPLLINANKCVKDPLVLAFVSSHFCPLIAHSNINFSDLVDLSASTNIIEQNTSAINNSQNNDNDNDNDNVDDVDAILTSSIELRQTRKLEAIQSLTAYFPLEYPTKEKMNVHFLTAGEINHKDELLNVYMNVSTTESNILVAEQTAAFLPTYLNKLLEKYSII